MKLKFSQKLFRRLFALLFLSSAICEGTFSVRSKAIEATEFQDNKKDFNDDGQMDQWIVKTNNISVNVLIEQGIPRALTFFKSISSVHQLIGFFNLKDKKLYVWKSKKKILGIAGFTNEQTELELRDCAQSNLVNKTLDFAMTSPESKRNFICEKHEKFSLIVNDSQGSLNRYQNKCLNVLLKSPLGSLKFSKEQLESIYLDTMDQLESLSNSNNLFRCEKTETGKAAEFVEEGGLFKIRLDPEHEDWTVKSNVSEIIFHEYLHAVFSNLRKERFCTEEGLNGVLTNCIVNSSDKEEEKMIQDLVAKCAEVRKTITTLDIAEAQNASAPQPVPPPLEVTSPPPFPVEVERQVSNHSYLPAEEVMKREIPRGYAALAEARARPLFDWVDKATRAVEKQVKGNWNLLPNADAQNLDLSGNYRAPGLGKSKGPVVAKLNDQKASEDIKASERNPTQILSEKQKGKSANVDVANGSKVATGSNGNSRKGQFVASASKGVALSNSVTAKLNNSKAGADQDQSMADPNSNPNPNSDSDPNSSADGNSKVGDRAPSSVNPEAFSAKTVEKIVAKAKGADIIKNLYVNSDPARPNKQFIEQLKKLKYSIRDINGNHFGVLENKAAQCYVLRAVDEPLVGVNCIARKR